MDDLNIVKKIYDHLSPDYRIFFSPENQNETFTRDQADSFSAIFLTTKLNFIFLGNKYGKTKWTRFEEQVIKNRYIEESPNTLGIVKLTKGISKPLWYSPLFGYINYLDFEFEEFITVIKHAIHSAQVRPSKESLVEMAIRIDERKKNNEIIRNYSDSLDAFSDTFNETTLLWEGIINNFQKIADSFKYAITKNEGVNFDFEHNDLNITSGLFSLYVHVRNGARNRLSGFTLSVMVKGRTSEMRFGSEPKVIFYQEYDPILSESLIFNWKSREGDIEITTNELAERIVREFIQSTAL